MRRWWNDRDWALGLAPQELVDRREGLVFAAICVVALGLVATADLHAPRQATVGPVALLPVAAAAWLLSARLTAAITGTAMVMALAVAVTGAVHPLTATTEVLVIPVLALLARLAATSVVRSRREERAAISARASEEEARELERAKSQFLRVASHELRGPLAILRGYLELMEDGSLGHIPAGAAAVLPRLSATASGMNRTVDQMLDAARLEDARLQLKPTRADLAATIRDVAANLRLLHANSHDIVCRNCDQPALLDFDRERIATVLGNLLSNAIKYSPAGAQVSLLIERHPDRVHVHVSDQGVGIAEGDLDRLFRRFGRIVTEDTQAIPGTGLGLYLSRELARLHGGDIGVRSRPGEGSTFTLTLPMPGTGTAAAPAPAPAPARPAPARGERSAPRRIAG